MSKTVGLFFGSFNPVHVGHLIIASQVVEQSLCDETWMVVSPQNPFKEKHTLLPQRQRLYMVNLAIEDDPRLRASDVEFALPVPSYTVDTLAYLTEKYPDVRFNLVMGSDNLMGLPRWKNPQVILDRHDILVYPRPGYDGGDLNDHPRVQWLDMPLLQISASFIRRSRAEGRSVRYLLSDPVYQYVDEMHFFAPGGPGFTKP
jgi:nicotinate-nucleotide adenylyltransferase